MRRLFLLSTTLCFLASATAEDKKPAEKPIPSVPLKKATPNPDAPKEKPEEAKPKLGVGDAAPAFKADKWLQGAEVKAFEEGKTYVVEFWATWCGPCIVMMPHMGELQDEYREKGTTFIGFTATNTTNNSLEKVKDFVEKRGPKLGYTFATQEGRETNNAWMTASGQRGIPCCFVVDGKGKIAYIGHPMYLDVVLPKVVAGTWTAEDAKGMDDVEAEVSKVFRSLSGEPKEALETFDAFTKKYPKLAGIPYFTSSRLNALLKLEKYDDVKYVATNLIKKAEKHGDSIALQMVSGALRSPAARENKEMGVLAIRAAHALLQMNGESDIGALMNAASTYEAAGDKANAKSFAEKAVPLAEKAVKGDQDFNGLLTLAEVSYLAGDKEKAKATARRLLDHASPQLKRFLENRTKKYLGGESENSEEKKKD